ncbi:hypothetical protein ColLi_11437 [Colletotrichum liriopes]|uniref:Uncharacterized protein n=1 Tax=Colletotrichum liriopes TaxID=708192 RepID=A0AA37LXQ6_9PEZI|nr:hypothetical protein ColLi_11437 [Colletotrichum liriopes]
MYATNHPPQRDPWASDPACKDIDDLKKGVVPRQDGSGCRGKNRSGGTIRGVQWNQSQSTGFRSNNHLRRGYCAQYMRTAL